MARSGCRERYRIISRHSQPQYQTGVWKPDEEARFVSAIQAQYSTDIDDFLYSKIDWASVSQIVNTRDARQCCLKWTTNGRNLFSNGNKGVDEPIKLFTILNQLSITDDLQVDWVLVSELCFKQYQKVWNGPKLAKYWKRVKMEVPEQHTSSWKSTVDYLIAREKLAFVDEDDEE